MSFRKLLALGALVLAPAAARADYKISDFAGEYYLQTSSGTPNVTSVNPQNAPSSNGIMLAKADKHGNGKTLYISYTQFYGPIPSPSTPTTSNITTLRSVTGAPEFAFKIILRNKELGTGTLTLFNFPVAGQNLDADFIAIKKNGKIQKVVFNEFTNPSLGSPGSFIAERR
jgi:hypothetical protein